MSSSERIATLALTSVVIGFPDYRHDEGAGISGRLRRSTMSIGRYALLKSIGRLDTLPRTRNYSLITNC
jgi:hypothetical protein